MTELCYLPDDDYVREFDATVESRGDSWVELDRTYFYKEGGGQPADHGTLSWDDESTEVVDVQKEHGVVKHYVDGPLPSEQAIVEGVIDWDRRYKHMRMHTAQHIVSWEALQLFDASTAGNQIYTDRSRIDLSPVSFDADDIQDLEAACNQRIADDLDVVKETMRRSQVEEAVDPDRTNLDLIPSSVDPLRVVRIGDEDLCPCGGTHVDSTSEVGEIVIDETENKGADTVRLYFYLEPRERQL